MSLLTPANLLPKKDIHSFGGKVVYLTNESTIQLNRSAVTLSGAEASYRVHYWGVDPVHYSNPVHKHSFFEVCYVLSGNGYYHERGVTYELTAGTMFCSRPGIMHQITSETGLYLLFVAFEVSDPQQDSETVRFYDLLSRSGKVCLPTMQYASVVELWKSLLIPRTKEHALPSQLLSVVAHTLLSCFPLLFLDQNAPKERAPLRTNFLLERAKLYIRDNLDQPLTLSVLANYLNISERHLSRLFSEGIDESFNRFVRIERIRQAAHLLRNSNLAIKEIAFATGFGSVHSFTRAFTMEMKMPPGKFRADSDM